MRAELTASGGDAPNCRRVLRRCAARDDTRLLRCDVLADHLVMTVRRDGGPLLTTMTAASADRARPGRRRVRSATPRSTTGSIIIAEESLIEPRLVPARPRDTVRGLSAYRRISAITRLAT